MDARTPVCADKGEVDGSPSVAEHFGGGGQVNSASGCALDGPVSVAAERILAQLRMERKTV